MRSCEHMVRHMSVVTHRDNEKVGSVDVMDPFHTTRVVIGFSFWECVRMLFRKNRTTEVRVSVQADGVAMDRWFLGQDTCESCKHTKLGPLPGVHETDPGYHHGKERWCERCYYGYEPEESVAVTAECT